MDEKNVTIADTATLIVLLAVSKILSPIKESGSEKSTEYKIEFRKTTQSEEPIGTEIRKIDSRNSKIKIERNIKVSKTWSQEIKITLEESTTQSMETKIEGSLGISKGCTVGGAVNTILEEKIAEQFQIAQQEKNTYEESVRIEIPQNEYVEIYLNWKQIWQHGEIVLLDAESGKEAHKIPFRFIDHITFDMS